MTANGGRSARLAVNFMVFLIGNLGSKLIAILLLPLYSRYLRPSDFGRVDLLITTADLLIPLVFFCVNEAVLRFVMDAPDDRKRVLSTGLAWTGVLIVALLAAYPVLHAFRVWGPLLPYLLALMALQAFQTPLANYSRAVGMNRVFATTGVVQALALGIGGVVFLVILRQGAEGYLWSILASSAAASVFLALRADIVRNVRPSAVDPRLLRRMLIFSAPLVPNAVLWWLVTASNRFFLNHFHGAALTGLFAMAARIPSLLTIVTTIFGQAWQMTANTEYDAVDREAFYSKVFLVYQSSLLVATALLLPLLPGAATVLFAADFASAWRYAPPLLMAAVFSSFSAFVGTIYTASMKTVGVMRTSLAGGAIALALNFALVPRWGAMGAGTATAGAFCALWLIRVWDTRGMIRLHVRWGALSVTTGVVLTQTLILLTGPVNAGLAVLLWSLAVVALTVNRHPLQELLARLKGARTQKS